MFTKDQGQIVFYYLHATLFEDVQHQSAFMCKNIASKEGEDLSEKFAITDDEAGMFALCLRETMPTLFDVVKPIAHGITDAFMDKYALAFFSIISVPVGEVLPENTYRKIPDPDISGNIPYFGIGPDGEMVYAILCESGALAEDGAIYYSKQEKDCVVIRVKDYGAHEQNDEKQADSALQSAIEAGAIAQFYTRVLHPDLTKLSASLFVGETQTVAKRIIPLRRMSEL